MCSMVIVVSHSNKRDIDVNENSHRSSWKEHPRLPLDDPHIFQSVLVLQRDVRVHKMLKTFKNVGLNVYKYILGMHYVQNLAFTIVG